MRDFSQLRKPHSFTLATYRFKLKSSQPNDNLKEISLKFKDKFKEPLRITALTYRACTGSNIHYFVRVIDRTSKQRKRSQVRDQENVNSADVMRSNFARELAASGRRRVDVAVIS